MSDPSFNHIKIKTFNVILIGDVSHIIFFTKGITKDKNHFHLYCYITMIQVPYACVSLSFDFIHIEPYAAHRDDRI